MMTTFKYIIRSLIHYRKQHLALFAGIALTSAVLTGALIAGDSIRHSLQKIVTTRTGKARSVIVGGSRYLQTSVAGRMEQSLKTPVVPVLLHQGIAIEPDSGIRVNNVGILGIDSSFNAITFSDIPIPSYDEVVVGEILAERLGVEAGDQIIVRAAPAGLIPVNAPFAQEPPPTKALRLIIKAIASDEQLARFNLANNQSAANNVFISSAQLNEALEMNNKSNILLLAERENMPDPAAIEESLRRCWKPEDIGLIIKDRTGGYFDLVSERIFIDTVIQRLIEDGGFPHQKIITYLVNDITVKGKTTPYSFASALPESLAGFNPGEQGVIINQWTADDLGARVNDSVTISWFEIGALRELRETDKRFRIKHIIPNRTAQIDSTLMPKFQGLSEAGNCRDWDAGVPIDLKRIRDKDEVYWDEYRGTPKVILSLSTGERLWKNSFGTLTSIRFHESQVSKEALTKFISEKLQPADLGLQAVDMRSEGGTAAENAVNFTELFLGMSFFVIAAALLLTLLIYSLHFDVRASETAVLSGLGFEKKKIISLRVYETVLIIMLGSITGSLLGVLYNSGIMAALNTVWNDMVRTDMLSVHISFSTLLTGTLAVILIAIFPVYFVTVRKLKKPLSVQLNSAVPDDVRLSARKGKKALTVGTIFIMVAFVIAIYGVIKGEVNNAALYLISAGLFLAGSIIVISGFLKNYSGMRNPTPNTVRLAFKNIQRNPARSLSVITLLSIGTFAIFLTGANRKTFFRSETDKASGTGGFAIWAETTSPVPFNLNSSEGRNRLITYDENDLAGVRFLQFERLEGDDASCLNLNQAQRPRLLAVNAGYLDSAEAFSFVKLLPGIPDDKPWQGLQQAYNDSVFPAYADQNVLQYSLQKKLGDTLIYLGESGNRFSLVLAGALRNSVFQGNLLISEDVFRKQFPSSGGSKTILIDASLDKQELVSEILSQSLIDYGIEVTPTSTRLATFNSVENTYLSVFMVLSGLGFLVGTIGLGIVLVRNVNERRRELALMLAVGYRRNQLIKMIFLENFWLLLSGFIIGLFASITGILPSLLSPSFQLHGEFLIAVTMLLFISGLIWIYFPLRAAMRQPLIGELRNE